jgi:hypothetical protein
LLTGVGNVNPPAAKVNREAFSEAIRRIVPRARNVFRELAGRISPALFYHVSTLNASKNLTIIAILIGLIMSLINRMPKYGAINVSDQYGPCS